jgi:hypothetical protein
MPLPAPPHEALELTSCKIRSTDALEGGLVYTGWNMTCSPRANRQYPAPERAAGRRHGTGGATLKRIQKSKNIGSWCAKALYCTKYKYLVKNGGTSTQFWKGYFEKPGPKKNLVKRQPYDKNQEQTKVLCIFLVIQTRTLPVPPLLTHACTQVVIATQTDIVCLSPRD